jgi:uncharacterized UPF0160 family protein
MKIVTHSGRFHADEIFSCAALSILNKGDVEIVRSRDPEVWATSDMAVDVGGVYDPGKGRFDHHQVGGAGARENGIPYSSFGLIWKEFGEKLIGGPAAAKALDERLVQPIDAGDNGVETFSLNDDTAPYLIQNVVGIFAPAWNESRTEDEGFFEALEVAKKILARAILQAQSVVEGKSLAEAGYARAEDKRIIVLDKQYPWHEVLSAHPEPLYVVLPQRGDIIGWKVEAVRNKPHTFKNRKDFPETWGGKREQELAQITGVADAIFCHNNRFIAVAGSKEGALALAKLAVEA